MKSDSDLGKSHGLCDKTNKAGIIPRFICFPVTFRNIQKAHANPELIYVTSNKPLKLEGRYRRMMSTGYRTNVPVDKIPKYAYTGIVGLRHLQHGLNAQYIEMIYITPSPRLLL